MLNETTIVQHSGGLPESRWRDIMFVENYTEIEDNENLTQYPKDIDRLICRLLSGFVPSKEYRTLFGDFNDSIFIIIAAFVIFILGAIGNIITICKISSDQRLHKPVYILLRSIAVADLFSLIVRYVVNFTTLQNHLIFCSGIRLPLLFDLLFFGTHHNSVFHIVMLCGYRLFLILQPIKCQCVISIKTIIFGSSCLWIASFIVGFVFAFSIKMTVLSSEVNVAYSGYSLFVPCFLIITFHCIKTRASSTDPVTMTTIRTLSHSVRRRLNMIMCAIIVVYTIPCVFDLVWFTLSLIQPPHIEGNTIDTWIDRVSKVASLAWLFSYSVNPVIYFFHSKQIRHYLCRK